MAYADWSTYYKNNETSILRNATTHYPKQTLRKLMDMLCDSRCWMHMEPIDTQKDILNLGCTTLIKVDSKSFKFWMRCRNYASMTKYWNGTGFITFSINDVIRVTIDRGITTIVLNDMT